MTIRLFCLAFTQIYWFTIQSYPR